MQIAEDIDLKKQDLEGVMREFKQSQRKSFPESGLKMLKHLIVRMYTFKLFNSGIVGPLSLSDIHRCIQFAMESVHFDPDTKTLPGYSKHQVWLIMTRIYAGLLTLIESDQGYFYGKNNFICL